MELTHLHVRTYLLFFLVFMTVNIFALEIELTKKFSLQNEAETKRSTFSLQITKTKLSNNLNNPPFIHNNIEKSIENSFKRAIQIAKSSHICQGGKYSITPFENRSSNKSVSGYRGYISFDCEFKDDKKYADVLSKVKKISTDIKLAQNPISYISLEEDNIKFSKTLELMAYKFANEHSQFISKNIRKICTTKNITFSNFSSMPTRHNLNHSFAKVATEVTAPVNNLVVHTTNAKFIFDCN